MIQRDSGSAGRNGVNTVVGGGGVMDINDHLMMGNGAGG